MPPDMPPDRPEVSCARTGVALAARSKVAIARDLGTGRSERARETCIGGNLREDRRRSQCRRRRKCAICYRGGLAFVDSISKYVPKNSPAWGAPGVASGLES